MCPPPLNRRRHVPKGGQRESSSKTRRIIRKASGEGPLVGGRSPRWERRLAPAPTARETSAGTQAEQQNHDGSAKNRRENRDARQRQLEREHVTAHNQQPP